MSLLQVERLFSLTNANVGRVLTVVDRYRSDCVFACPSSEKCKGSIIAAALNTLPTHYYVDESRQRAVGSPWVLVESAVAEALETVCNRQGSRNSSKFLPPVT